jgi:hypothetical protein
LDKSKLSDGIFSVSWLVLSRDDGNITKGTYVFSIQSPEQQQLQQESDNNNTFSEHAIVDNVNMTLMISPFSVGQNTFNVIQRSIRKLRIQYKKCNYLNY